MKFILFNLVLLTSLNCFALTNEEAARCEVTTNKNLSVVAEIGMYIQDENDKVMIADLTQAIVRKAQSCDELAITSKQLVNLVSQTFLHIEAPQEFGE
jgi:hypothetical protein